MVIGPLDRLQTMLAAEVDGQVILVTASRPIALGWATVELERAAVDLGAELHIPASRFLDTRATGCLGAHCRVARGVLPDGISLVLLEPATEGRLAATLARSGEGPAAVWLAVDDLPSAIAVLRAGSVETSIERPGPFGSERLVLIGPSHGPHRLLVEQAGTIRP